jgi:cation transporter-like permease
MEESRKHLKITSIVILILTVASILSIASGIIGLKNAVVPEGAPANTVEIAQIFVTVLSGVLLLPQIYIGFKGLKVAKNPDSSKAHIIVAFILLALTVVDMVSGIVSGISIGSAQAIIRPALALIVDVLVYADYIKYARLVANGR